MDGVSKTVNVNYESKTQVVNSKTSGSFSLRIRLVERILIRSPTGHEFLTEEKVVVEKKEAAEEIPYKFLAEEEICREYLAVVFKPKFSSWIQQRIVPKLSKDVVSMSRRLGEIGERGFLLEADVEISDETWFDNWINPNDYDSQIRLIPIEQECTICLEELSLGGGQKKIMKLPCHHNFHTECIRPWLKRKHSCPTCRDDVQNPRPQKEVQHMIFCGEAEMKIFSLHK